MKTVPMYEWSYKQAVLASTEVTEDVRDEFNGVRLYRASCAKCTAKDQDGKQIMLMKKG
jgi:hypothetical protein